ncbi:MAG: hypothetical protein R2684_13585 [Pyrinomonadaceae bacterium]
MKIESGEIVVLIMREPREKILGIVDEINPAGIFIRGIDLGYFDEWVRAIAEGEQYLPMHDSFYPMWRVERMSKDEAAEGTQSMGEIFAKRTGRLLGEF